MTIAKTRAGALVALVAVDAALTCATIMYNVPAWLRFTTVAVCIATVWLAHRVAKATK